MGDDFSNRPGRQMGDDFFNGTGRVDKREMSFPMEGQGYKKRKTKHIARQSGSTNLLFFLYILLLLLLLLLLNEFPNLHPVYSFHNSDLLIPFVINFECLYLERR